MPKKLILDVDTGTDDAVALMLAALHPDLELVAATTVNGNVPVAYCTDNTLRVLDLLERGRSRSTKGRRAPGPDDFPIPREIRIRRAACTGSSCHPCAALGQAVRRATIPGRDLSGRHGADHPGAGRPADQHRVCDQAHPRIVERIPATVIMGGAHAIGNVTPSAEFNIWVDPEAARSCSPPGSPDHARAARRHAPGAGFGRRLREAACARHAGRRRGGGVHRGPDRGLRHAPTDGHAPHGAGPRCPVCRLPDRPDGRQRPA